MQVNDDETLSPEERIKQLVESEDEKRKELEDKKEELEKKKKELTQLEQQREQETLDARKEIEEKIEELATDEKQRFEELEELRRRREQEQASSLEETIEGEEKAGRIQEVPQQRGYGEAIEEILRGNPNFYDITNYNVVNRLESLTQKAPEQPLTESERTFIENVRYHAEKMQRTDDYRQMDKSDYISKELEQIDKINRSIREREKIAGDYHP